MPKKDETQVPMPTAHQAQQLTELPHRVQSAIAFLMEQPQRLPQVEPKHLRVGVNSALLECSAMARLLFRKGLITSDEYFDTLIEAWEQEVDSYRSAIKNINPHLEI